MTDKNFSRWLFVSVFVIGLFLLALAQGVFASERYDISADAAAKANADAVSTSSASAIGGDTNTNIDTGGNTSLALVNSLGDVDIAGCLGSTQWNTPIYGRQKLVLNWPCIAEFYLRNEKWALAAMALCNTEILDEFASEIDCEVAHDFKPLRAASVPMEPVLIYDSDDEDDERRDEQLEQLARQLAQYGEQVQRTERRQQMQQQQIDVQQHHEDVRQKKLELIKREFGDNGNE